MRSLFAIVNFAILFFAMAYPYQMMAREIHAKMIRERRSPEIGSLEIPPGTPIPTLEIVTTEDAHGGWSVFVKTENFKFSPENSGGTPAWGEGHAHVYVNGEKIMRLYGPWFHLNLPKGKSWLKVGLYSNDHKPYAAGGKPIAQEIQLQETRDTGSSAHAH